MTPAVGHVYISRDMIEDGAFLQLFSDRIRVGLPMHGFGAEDACLLLVLPPDDPAAQEPADVVFFSTPDGVGMRQAPAELAKGAKVAFDAVVGKCTSYGLFVDLPDLAIGGMVHVSKLSQAFVRWDAAREALVDGRQVWQVGTKMKVRVAAVDFDQRKIDFVPAGEGGMV